MANNRNAIVSMVVAAIILMMLPSVGLGEEAFDAKEQDRFITNSRQLTYQGKRAGEGYFSPDGDFFIFQSERDADNPFYQIFMLSLKDGETHRLSPGTGKTTCAFFRPDSDDVLFASTHLDPEAKAKQEAEIEFRASGKERRYSWDYDEQFDVFSCRRDGSGLVRLTDTQGYDAEGGYSPDGTQIVFCSLRDAYPADKLSSEDQKLLEVDPAYFGEIYIMDADGSNQTRLTDWPGYDGGPFFSPDGKRIVWRHFDESGMLADVYTMRLDGSDRRRVTDFESMCWAPYYHPSGKYIVFTSNKLGFSNFELFIADVYGDKEPVRATFTDGFDGLPVFSPDGRRLAWTSTRTSSKSSQIFIADWNHEAALASLREAPVRPRDGERRFSPDISVSDLQANVEYLASDRLEGRMTGSDGARLAGDYIAERMKAVGLEPFGDNGSFFQEFPFTSGIKTAATGNRLKVAGSNSEYLLEKDFSPLAFTANGDVEGAVVFAGYGLYLTGDEGEGYDSYADLDVTDKIVLVLRYVPEDVDMERRQALNHYAGLRYKAMLARERGAKALLVVTGPNSPNAGELVPLKFDQSVASSGIVVASISGNIADALFAGYDKDLETVQAGLDIENPHVEGSFDLPDAKVAIAAAVEREERTGRNVVGFLPASGTGDRDQYVVIGAHYDHIGRGETGSLARKGEEGEIHNGADDNASGTATVLELAGALAELGRTNTDIRRGVIVALWSGEEIGILGSSYFAEHPPVAMEGVAAYFNFDMVGRLRDNKLILQGTGSSDEWAPMIEQRNVAAGFNLVLQEDPYLPTDVTAFYPKNVAVVSFFTGSHEDYNRPTDDAATLNYDGMERIARFAYTMIADVVEAPEPLGYVKVERSKQQTGGRASLRVYLGTIPDYAGSDVEGVKLSGVRAGGPADKAGLQGGDIIVEFAGQKIANIYDYTYALDAVKIGEPVEVVVLRNEERVTLTVMPEVRK